MRTKIHRILGAMFLLCACTTAAHASSYPPPNPGVLPNGNAPGCQSPDTLYRIENIQNPNLPSAACHPVPPDTVYGVAGIITGFDPIPTGFAIYVQNSDGNPWGGIDLFTGGTNYQTLFTPNLALGDSISFSGRMDEFGGGGEIRGFASSAFNPPLPAVRRLSIGNPLPPFKRGTVNLLNELNANPNAEQWEGCLVRVSSDQHKLRVVRTTDQNAALNTPSSFLVVDNVLCPTNAVGPCDSLFIDGSTLAVVGPPTVGALVDSVQGIYDQRARGYRIQLRSGNDLFDTSPPNLLDAFPIATGDTIRVVFDRDLTLASAQNKLNYSITSTGFPPDGAVQQVDKRVVHLKVTALADGSPEGVTVNGVVNANNGQAMTSADTRNFFSGVMPIATVQAPDGPSLGGAPCSDRSKFAGAGNQVSGGRMSTRGVCIAAIGSTFWIETAAGGARSGIAVFAPSAPLTVGRQYLIAGATQEFFTESELAGTVFVKDEGAVAIPAATIKPIGVLRDTTCDPTQSLDTGEDYEGMLIKVVDVKTVDERTAGQNFFAAGPYPSNPDTILIDSDAPRTFDPSKNQYVTVTGVEDVSFEAVGTTFRIQPRNNADIVVNATLGVDPTATPGEVSFSIAPNVGRASQITFAVPKADHVFIGVYDIAGRQRAVLADRDYPAGTWHVDWNGRDGNGRDLGSGVYFYKLKVNGQTLSQRSVVLN